MVDVEAGVNLGSRCPASPPLSQKSEEWVAVETHFLWRAFENRPPDEGLWEAFWSRKWCFYSQFRIQMEAEDGSAFQVDPLLTFAGSLVVSGDPVRLVGQRRLCRWIQPVHYRSVFVVGFSID